MANNKVSSLFNQDLPKPKRSNFNLGRVNRFSADVGWLIPCYVEEVLPNSYKRLDLEALIQTNATVAPLMGSFKVKVDAFFVPRRLYHQHLDMNDIRPNFSDDFDYHYLRVGASRTIEILNNIIPGANTNILDPISFAFQTFPEGKEHGFTAPTTLKVAPGSLLDYLGVLPVGFNSASWNDQRKLDALPFIGYYDIFRNYYINPHDSLVPFRIRNFSSDYDLGSNLDYGADRYVESSSFDKFIRNITLGSLNSSMSPTPVDVFARFNADFNFISDNPSEPFSFPPQYAGQLVSSGNPLGDGVQAADTRDGRHFGLLRRTYMDDYFTSRFMNSFVTYMEESSKVQVRDNDLTFTITQMRLANRIAKYVDKSIFSDTRFGSWIKAHFGVKTNQKLCIPQFLGSITSNIVFNDIYSTAQTGDGDISSNEALGSRSSLGQGYIKNKGAFVEFQATEPGVLMCIFSITPYVNYFQGIKKMYLKTSFADMYTPEFDAVGYDDIQKLEFSAVPNYAQVYGYTRNLPTYSFDEYNVSLGKHPAWMEYMTSTDECHGLMAEKYQYGYWLLNRPFSPYAYDPVLSDGENAPSFDGDAIFLEASTVGVFENSTYINPEYFNAIFAVDKWNDNFQVQIRWYDKTKQPISKQILPHL